MWPQQLVFYCCLEIEKNMLDSTIRIIDQKLEHLHQLEFTFFLLIWIACVPRV
jgi:hypothetical protein